MTQSPVTLGIDLGGTKIDIGVVDQSGKILQRELIKTNKNGAQFVVNDIKNVFEKLQSTTKGIEAAGVGMAGQIEANTGRVHFAPNLGWKNYELAVELENVLQIPVRITNDVRAAAWGEWLYGAGKECNDMVCLFVGTGIGAGIVSGGKMLTGASNAGGEIGHMTIDLHGPLCTCGNKGCFEALASGWAIAKRVKEVMTYDSVESKKLLDLTGGTVEELTARDVIEAYHSKVSVAIRVIEEVKTALVAGAANIINTFNPSKLILGGGIINGAPFLVDVIRDKVPERALKSSVDNLQIVTAMLKGDAGVVGAAAFAKKNYTVPNK